VDVEGVEDMLVVDNGMLGGCGTVGADVVVVEVDLLAGSTISGGFTASILDRGDAEAACSGEIDLSRLVSIVALAAVLRPQNDNKPPPIFFPLPASADCASASLSFSTTFQPTGKSSWTTSGRDFTDVSHAVDPFEAMSCDMGLSRVRWMCLLSRIDSAMDLAVNDLPNGIAGGGVISSGAIRFMSAMLI
jgi:hypothetical protein